MQLFSADAIVFSKKLKKNFWPWKSEKTGLKVAHNQPRPFYFTVQPRPLRPQPRIDFSYYEISGPDICSLICGLALFTLTMDAKDACIHNFENLAVLLWFDFKGLFLATGASRKVLIVGLLIVVCREGSIRKDFGSQFLPTLIKIH